MKDKLKLNPREPVINTDEIHILELFYLLTDLDFCPQSSNFYMALPYSTTLLSYIVTIHT